MTHLLSVSGLSCSFGALHVIKDINFDVREGETVGVIGPNGAGKTTLMSLIAGSQRPSKGRIAFAGQDITEYSVHERARSGLARTYQVPRPFSHMTVDQNLRVAAHFAAGDRDATERVNDVLSICGLERVRNKEAGSLPLLQRKRHELARALASNPKLLLVDEVAAGLTEREVDEFIELIGTIKSRGITVIGSSMSSAQCCTPRRA